MRQTALATGLAAVLASAAFAPAAQADAAYGFGISYVFGGGGSDVAVGVRVFSDDTPEDGAVSLGLDYKLGSQSLRPTIGAAYLDDDVYGEINLGYDMGGQDIDFGIGVGGWGGF